MSRRRSSNKTPKKVFTKLKWHVSDYIKIGTSLHCKKAKTKLKGCKKDWEILVMSKADKGLIFRIYKKLTCLLRNLYAGQEATVRTGDGTTDWFQIRKGIYIKAVYCHPAYLTYMHSTSREMPGWMKHKLE